MGVWGDQNFIADSAAVDASGHLVLRRKKLLAPGFYTFLLPGMKQLSFLIDKDQRPAWNPVTLTDVSEERVESYFAPIVHEWELPPELVVPNTTSSKL